MVCRSSRGPRSRRATGVERKCRFGRKRSAWGKPSRDQGRDRQEDFRDGDRGEPTGEGVQTWLSPRFARSPSRSGGRSKRGGPHPGVRGAEAGRGPHLRPRMTLVMSRTTCAAGVRALTPSPGGASACACAASCLGSDSLPRSAGHAICRLRSCCFPCSSSILSTRPEKRPGDRRRDHLQEPRALVDHATGIQAPLTGGRVEIEIALSGSRCPHESSSMSVRAAPRARQERERTLSRLERPGSS